MREFYVDVNWPIPTNTRNIFKAAQDVLKAIYHMNYRFPKDEDFSYLTGVYLALNAVADAYLLMDAPTCCYKKIEFIDKNHDLFADLFRTDGFHRIANTRVFQGNVMRDRTSDVEEMLVRMAQHDAAGIVWLCSMPMASVTGMQYDLLARRAQYKSGIQVIEIPSKALSENWLEGYSNVLVRLAEELPLDPARKKKNAVAIIGYFFDRHEGDHFGNLQVLRQIFDKLGYELVSVWLDGGGTEQLTNIEKAVKLVSLPYGGDAGRILAEKTKAELLELDLPLGVANSTNWLRKLGVFLERENEAEAYIDQEMHAVMPILELVCPQFVLDQKVTLLEAVHLCRVLESALEEFGARVENKVVFGSSDETIPECSHLNIESEQVCIGNTFSMNIIGSPVRFMQFGFPTIGNHYLLAEPFLFYRGFVSFLNKFINVVNSRQVLEGSQYEF